MAGETVMWAGDESRTCANLQSGVLKVVAATTDGREQIVSLVYPADFVGEPYTAEIAFTVTALTDAELCTFPRLLFERFLEEHARMENLLLQRTFKALNEARARMLTLARLSAGEKVAGLLLDMAARAGRYLYQPGPAEPITFDLPMTRGHMADVLGMTIETVSRQLTKLKSAEVIALSGARTVTIVDGHALKERAMAA
jgi:CRP/FNR family transcriptional regulator, anaerobic regulatory protein